MESRISCKRIKEIMTDISDMHLFSGEDMYFD